MFRFKTIFFILFAVNLCKINAIISDKRLCVDDKCSVQVGEGKTLIRYASPDRRILSFAPNMPVKIYSHGAGLKPMYIGVELNGKRGYVNKDHIRETKIFNKPTKLVSTETELNNPQDTVSQIQPDAVKQGYEIIDGTKIPLDSDFGTSTPSPESIKSSTVVVPDQPSNEKTEDLVLDLNKNENTIKSSHIETPKVENVVKQPELVSKTVEDPKVINDVKQPEIVPKIMEESKINIIGESASKVADKVDQFQNNQFEEKLQNVVQVPTGKGDDGKVVQNSDKAESKLDQDSDDNDEYVDVSDDDDNDDDEEEEPEEKGFFSKIVDTLESLTKEEPELFESTDNEFYQEKVTIMDKPNQDAKIQKTVNNNNNVVNGDLKSSNSTVKKVNEEEVNINNEKIKQDFISLDNANKIDDSNGDLNEQKLFSESKGNQEELKIVETANQEAKLLETVNENSASSDLNQQENIVKESKTVFITNNKAEFDDKIAENSYNPSKEILPNPTLADNKDPFIAYDAKEKLTESLGSKIISPKPGELKNLHEKSVLPNDQIDNTITIPTIVDNEALPFNDAITLSPILNQAIYSDISNKEKSEEVAFNAKNEEPKEEKKKILEKPLETISPSDLAGFGGLGLGLFNHPKIVNDENSKKIDIYENEAQNFVESVTSNLETMNSTVDSVGINQENNELKHITPEESSPNRPDLGPNEPTFIDTTSSQDEPERVLVEKDVEDNNGTEEFQISKKDLEIPDVQANLHKESSGGFLSSISSFFGSTGVSGSEEVKQTIEAVSSPLYEEAVKNSDIVKEITEKPFIKSEAYVTGDTNSVNNEDLNVDKVKEIVDESLTNTKASVMGDINYSSVNSETINVDNLSETEDKLIKTVDKENLAADRSSEFSHHSNVPSYTEEKVESIWSASHDHCDTEQCFNNANDNISTVVPSLSLELILQSFSSDMFLYLSTTAISMVIFLFLYMILDKCKREAPLISRINKLEQELLATRKENQLLQEQDSTLVVQQPETVIQGVPNEIVEELTDQLREAQAAKATLEEQVAALEKELDNSTEVGIELNRIISDMLNSSDGSEILKGNVEQMQKRLLDQQETINTINENLNLRDTENHELRLELDISNKKVMDLQGEVDKMVERIFKIEEERDAQQSNLEKEIEIYQVKVKEATKKETGMTSELQIIKTQLADYQRMAELKIKEFNTLKQSIDEIKSIKNNKDVIKSLLEVTEIKAQLEQFKSENSRYSDQLRLEHESNTVYTKKIQMLCQEVEDLRANYEKADKEKVESRTKLEVLNNYFKEKEEHMQKEISKYESLWAVKEGHATSTTERIRLLQEELQNYKAQNESLKQEIMNQEVELKSQISVLEKKSHEIWMTCRQTERKLEEAKQEAAQLRNRLTMKERAALEGNNQMRMQSPLHQNGDIALSHPPLDATLSPPPPLIGNPRDLAMSPPIPGMPPLAFLPPPPGGLPPFMPPPPGGLPPHGMPPFMPPPIFPGDHRPPPLGRMSSPPPVNSRSYSPQSTIFSEYDRYDRNTPSPIYDSEYGASPPSRAYSPYEERLRDERLREDRRDFRRDEDRREYNRPHGRSNGRTSKGLSSDSENELRKINMKPNKKV